MPSCSRCGTELKKGAKFCHFCGQAVTRKIPPKKYSLEINRKQAAISYENLFTTVLKRHDLKTDHEKALAEFERYCDEQPDTAEKFFWLGNLQMIIGGVISDVRYGNLLWDKGIANYEKALQLRPDYLVVYSKLLGAHISKGDQNGAVSVAKRWLRIDPNSEPAKGYLWLTGETVPTKKQARSAAVQFWKNNPNAPGLCDVCSKRVAKGTGYLLHPKDILRSFEAYTEFLWKRARIEKAIGMSETEFKRGLRQRVQSDTTPWLVCESCIDIFLGS